MPMIEPLAVLIREACPTIGIIGSATTISMAQLKAPVEPRSEWACLWARDEPAPREDGQCGCQRIEFAMGL